MRSKRLVRVDSIFTPTYAIFLPTYCLHTLTHCRLPHSLRLLLPTTAYTPPTSTHPTPTFTHSSPTLIKISPTCNRYFLQPTTYPYIPTYLRLHSPTSTYLHHLEHTEQSHQAALDEAEVTFLECFHPDRQFLMVCSSGFREHL